MSNARKISIAIPTYMRDELLFKSFEQVYDDERIDEIVIVDDASDDDVFEKIRSWSFELPKIKLFKNSTNRDCYFNKYSAASYCTNDFIILFDSDNCLGTQYLDKIFSIPVWDKDVILAPTFAAPTFDYRAYSGLLVTKRNVAEYMDKPMFSTALNTMNFFINKNEYLKVFDGNVNPHTADSIYFNYCWLNSGKQIFLVPGLEYFHRVHDESHYKKNVHLTGNFYHEVESKLKALR